MELKDIKKAIEENLPGDKIKKVYAEGPKIAVYTDDLPYFIDNQQIVKDLANLVKKKIRMRSDPAYLLPPDEAKKEILSVVPAEANISEIIFDEHFGDVYIEADRLGVVIGYGGTVLNEIAKRTRWKPKLLRKSPIESKTISSIRKLIVNTSEDRLKLLRKIGDKIYSKPDATCDWIRLTPLGGGKQVGRSSFLVQTPSSNVLLDCGINVAASSDIERFPDFRAMELSIDQLDAIVISHAHLDHCGFLPYLFKYGYDGPVYCTEPTRDLMTLLQLDAIDVGFKDKQELPFSQKEVKRILEHTITLDYKEVADITPEVRLTLYNAGHILGSSIVHLHIGEGFHNLIYTGDIKFGDTRLLDAADYEFPRVETVVLESTYGGRYDMQPIKKDAEENLTKVLQKTIERGGKALIPVFGVGRAQEIMMFLENRFWSGEIKTPVYLEGMIWEATAIHTTYPEYLKGYVKGRIFKGQNPFLAENFNKVEYEKRSEIIKSSDPCIILATSGMMTGGPSVEYFKKLASDEKNTLVFVGYQASGSLGRRLQGGLREFPVEHNGRTELLEVKMEVATVDGFSGHVDRRQLLGFVKKISPRPKRILTVHGEPEKTIDLAGTLQMMFKVESSAPNNLDTVRLV